MEPEATSASQSDNRDHVLPEGKWQFDAEVTDVFDGMLRRSIPQYDVMRKAVFEIATRFAKEKTAIVDLGCSRGDALDPLISKYGAYNRFVGVEVSQPMLDAARKRFQGYIDCGVVSIREMDLRHQFPPGNRGQSKTSDKHYPNRQRHATGSPTRRAFPAIGLAARSPRPARRPST